MSSNSTKPEYPNDLYLFNMLTGNFSTIQGSGTPAEGRFKHQV